MNKKTKHLFPIMIAQQETNKFNNVGDCAAYARWLRPSVDPRRARSPHRYH